MKANLIAEANLLFLKGKKYPGRGIVMGMNQNDKLIQVYWIMGRSASSRNRIFGKTEDGCLYTLLADSTRKISEEERKLIIYNAMDEVGDDKYRTFVVSNGAQTDAIKTSIMRGHAAYNALQTWEHEPDVPNYTPRISAVCTLGETNFPFAELSILRKDPWNEGHCVRDFYTYETFPAGIGFCITTYVDDGEPLPSFNSAPLPVPLKGDWMEILNTFWDREAKYFPNLVSLAVKEVDIAFRANPSRPRSYNNYYMGLRC